MRECVLVLDCDDGYEEDLSYEGCREGFKRMTADVPKKDSGGDWELYVGYLS